MSGALQFLWPVWPSLGRMSAEGRGRDVEQRRNLEATKERRRPKGTWIVTQWEISRTTGFRKDAM